MSWILNTPRMFWLEFSELQKCVVTQYPKLLIINSLLHLAIRPNHSNEM